MAAAVTRRATPEVMAGMVPRRSRAAFLALLALLRVGVGLVAWAVLSVAGSMLVYGGATNAQYPTTFQLWAQPVPVAVGLAIGVRIALGGGALPGHGLRLIPFLLLAAAFLAQTAGVVTPAVTYSVWVFALLLVAVLVGARTGSRAAGPFAAI